MTEEQRQLAIAYQSQIDVRNAYGKMIYDDLKSFCSYERTILPTEETHTTAFILGMRDVFLHILTELEKDTSKPASQETASTQAGENRKGRQQETAEE